MEYIFIGQPSLKELRIVLNNERYHPTNRMLLRYNIRSYQYIKSLKSTIPKSRLARLLQFYKTQSEFEAFKIVYFLEKKTQHKNLHRFKLKSQKVLSKHFNSTDVFFRDLARLLAFNPPRNIPNVEVNSTQDKSLMGNTDLPPMEMFFTDTFSDFSDHTELSDKKTVEKHKRNLFFTSDSFFKEIGDGEICFSDIRKDNMGSSKDVTEKKPRRITINLKIKKKAEEVAPKPATDKQIVFANERDKKECSKRASSIMNQVPGVSGAPKNINFDSFISSDNDLIDFDFKKIYSETDDTATKPLKRQVLGPKDINRQNKKESEKNYEKILRRNTHINSNYKFIKVYHTNAVAKKVSLSRVNREKRVKFVSTYSPEPHNPEKPVSILQKTKFKKDIKPSKVKQTVFIKRLV
ncbi:hypothetical protein NGRA_0357 [Nosema granulosis]|uniref:Uncharacterized protein n=1 Tax=Nosema granulosis TaxID=83296 RepID=A0A9P6H0J9_9MICR|nr:hypothetical protein NGRA_0357 [Nosema granulosis]